MTPIGRLLASAAVAAAALVTGCGDDGPDDERTTADGLAVVPVAEGLAGPTQIVAAADDVVLVAELNGGEDAGTGRIVRFDLDRPDERDVLVDGLLTPTGLAVDGGLLWIMEQRTLSVSPLDDPGDRTTVLDGLPYNGRSEGTLTAVDGGGILYDTSGSRRGDQLVEGSGVLWYLAGPDAEPEPFATGFKHAYAHAPVGDGRWFVTEISDGTLDGEPPPDELVVAAAGDDFGYPRCIGDRVPVRELDATEVDCAATPRSHALLPPRSTPTSVAVPPWDPETVLVALWSTGELVAVPAEPAPDPHPPEVVLDGLERPQHLLVVGDRLLLTEFAGGRVLEIAPSDSVSR